jgi:hypothetical protein
MHGEHGAKLWSRNWGSEFRPPDTKHQPCDTPLPKNCGNEHRIIFMKLPFWQGKNRVETNSIYVTPGSVRAPRNFGRTTSAVAELTS